MRGPEGGLDDLRLDRACMRILVQAVAHELKLVWKIWKHFSRYQPLKGFCSRGLNVSPTIISRLAVLLFEHPIHMTLVGSRVARSKIWPILKNNNPHEDLLQRQIWLHSIVLSLPFWTRMMYKAQNSFGDWNLKTNFWLFENSFLYISSSDPAPRETHAGAFIFDNRGGEGGDYWFLMKFSARLDPAVLHSGWKSYWRNFNSSQTESWSVISLEKSNPSICY